MTLEQLLIDLGINIASSVIYDVAKSYFAKTSAPTIDGFKKEIESYLNIEGASIKADKITSFLAKNGDIRISGTQIYASESIILASTSKTKFSLENNSTSKTDKTSIEVGNGAKIEGQGGAKVVQNDDGSISFFA